MAADARVGGPQGRAGRSGPHDWLCLCEQDLPEPVLPEESTKAFDTAFNNIHAFHTAQLTGPMSVETMPGVTCRRISRPIGELAHLGIEADAEAGRREASPLPCLSLCLQKGLLCMLRRPARAGACLGFLALTILLQDVACWCCLLGAASWLRLPRSESPGKLRCPHVRQGSSSTAWLPWARRCRGRVRAGRDRGAALQCAHAGGACGDRWLQGEALEMKPVGN